jgi:hypothetical protein
MEYIQQCLASLRFVFTGETTCRICFVTAPVVWIFGSFLLGVNCLTIYSKYQTSSVTVYLILLGLFMLLCGIFSASNTIHVCIQLPTSQTALKIQKYGQVVVLGIYLLMLIVGWSLSSANYANDVETYAINKEFTGLLWQGITFLGLFFITTISCIYSSS